LVDNLSGRQLFAAAEVVFANNKRLGGTADKLEEIFLENGSADSVFTSPTTNSVAEGKRRRCANSNYCFSTGRTMSHK
jgi:hypothetical protein